MITGVNVGGKKTEVNLTWKEFKYKFFKKKKCPTCGGTMKELIKDVSLGDNPFVDHVDGTELNLFTERIVRTYAYLCNVCDKEYPIMLLANNQT